MYGVPKPDKVTYFDQVATSDAGRAYKRDVLAALDLRPGHTVLDVGCGPGTDLPAMATAVTESGSVLGVDVEPSMVAEAASRVAGTPGTSVRLGDAHALPLPDESVDRVRADRMVQHVTDPAAVLSELHRVLRPSGIACVAEPDWGALVIDPGDAAVAHAFTGFVRTTMVRNATIGRRLPRLATDAGLEVCDLLTAAPVFRDFPLADRILGLSRNTERAIRAGHLGRAAGERWLADLATGPFLAATLLFILVARRPTGDRNADTRD